MKYENWVWIEDEEEGGKNAYHIVMMTNISVWMQSDDDEANDDLLYLNNNI